MTVLSLQIQLDALNKEMAEIKATLPKPKPLAPPPKRFFSQLRHGLKVENRTPIRDPNRLVGANPQQCFNVKQAMQVAAERKAAFAKMGQYDWKIVFCKWDETLSDMKLAGDSICIVEELQATDRENSCFQTIKTWPFENKIPPNFVAE
jgi:hypothetical protein